MKGLELARGFYEVCRPKLYAEIPQLFTQACIGLCGEGSECFACDDELSKDHDFSAAFCFWLPENLLESNYKLITQVFSKLPKSYLNISTNFEQMGFSRRGPVSIEKYYKFFTGLNNPPQSWKQWLSIPEHQLAAATNGEIFEDNLGIFTSWRKKLQYYPHDIQLKKLAARAMQMAQSGQYNLARCLKRGEYAASFLALSKFTEAAIAFVFLANRRYMPFYKWAPHLTMSLPDLGPELKLLLEQITSIPLKVDNDNKFIDCIEKFCAQCASWLNDNKLSDVKDNWLWAHGPQIIKKINNLEIQSLNLLQESL